MEETKTPTMDLVQMKQRRDHLTMLVGQRTFNAKVIEAENLRDTQEILDLCNKINAADIKSAEQRLTETAANVTDTPIPLTLAKEIETTAVV